MRQPTRLPPMTTSATVIDRPRRRGRARQGTNYRQVGALATAGLLGAAATAGLAKLAHTRPAYVGIGAAALGFGAMAWFKSPEVRAAGLGLGLGAGAISVGDLIVGGIKPKPADATKPADTTTSDAANANQKQLAAGTDNTLAAAPPPPTAAPPTQPPQRQAPSVSAQLRREISRAMHAAR
ncbi:MAG TPA: hypothetical protein VGM90_16290 [Kofleriaceae bacterium]